MRNCLQTMLLVGLGSLLGHASPGAARGSGQQRPTFRAAAHLIVQTVAVKDGAGKPIEGLTASDFVVTEDGEPQEIAFVEYQAIDSSAPLSQPAVGAAATTPSAPGLPDAAPSPATRDSQYRGRRLLILYFDLTNMPFLEQMRTYGSADEYIAKRMTAADMVAIMVFRGGRLRLERDFTDDREALAESIQALMTAADESQSGLVANWDTGGAFGEDNETFNLFATDRQLAALQRAVTDLRPLPEVKTLVYFGSGLRLNGADNQAQLRATVNAAVRANVTLNPIDARGLVAAPPLGDASRPSPGGVALFSGRLAEIAINKQQQAQDTLYALASDTGGRAMFDHNDLSLGIAQAAAAVTGYYMIGYYSSHNARDGRFRRVTVTLTPQRPAYLSYRKGYYGEKEFSRFSNADKERQLEDALRLEDPITDIPIAMEVNYFQLNRAEYFVPISVRLPGAELLQARGNGPVRAQIDMIGEIKDEHGVTIQNAKDKLEFRVNPDRASQLARRAIQFETGFTLLPGSYVIKVLAREGTTGRIGTFQKSFIVPNLEREKTRLPISSVVIGSQHAASNEALYSVHQKVISDAAHPLTQNGRKLLPSVTRMYDANRPLFVLLHAYRHDATATDPLVAFVTLFRDGEKSFESAPMVFSEPWSANARAIPIRLEVPPGQVQPGAYDCQVTVLDPEAARAAFWRAAIVLVP